MNTTSPNYDFHIFICQNHRPNDPIKGCCLSKGSDKLLEYLKMQVKDLEIANVRPLSKLAHDEHLPRKFRRSENYKLLDLSVLNCTGEFEHEIDAEQMPSGVEFGMKSIKVTKSGCLSQCSKGIALVIYPQGVWYSIKSTDDVNEIVNSHIKNNKLVNHLLM